MTPSSRPSSARSATTSQRTRTPRTWTLPTRPPCPPPFRAPSPTSPVPRRRRANRLPAKYAFHSCLTKCPYYLCKIALWPYRKPFRSTSSVCRRFLRPLPRANEFTVFDYIDQSNNAANYLSFSSSFLS